MAKNIDVELGAVQETLLVPLYGRACETKRGSGLIHDPKSVEMVDALNYDFSKWKNIPSLIGATVRTQIYDQQVRAFLNAHPKGTIIEIGAGLNTRYERLDNGTAQWLEIDLPDSMELRRKFFDPTPRRRMIAASVLDTDWHARVKELPEPYFFVSEAVMIYLEQTEAEGAIQTMAQAFPGAQFFFDTTSKAMVEGQDKHDAMKVMPRSSWFRWVCDNPASLEKLGLEHKATLTMLDLSPEIQTKLPLSFRLGYKFFPWLLKRKVRGYCMSLFQSKAA